MKRPTLRKSPARNSDSSRTSLTARFSLPVRHPPLWRFILEQVLSPAKRLHRYRQLSVHMVEDTISTLDCRRCQ